MKNVQYSLNKLKPVLVNDLIRIGNKDSDGGYILSKRQIENTKILLGLGIFYDWTFEEAMKQQNNNLTVFAYDFSVGKSVFLRRTGTYIIDILSLRTFITLFRDFNKFTSLIKRPIKELNTYFSFKRFFNIKKNIFFFQKGISNYSSDIFIKPSEMFNHIISFNDLPDNSIYIKMDIEGSEYQILEDVIKHKSKINGLVVEFHGIGTKWNSFNSLILKLSNDFSIIHVHANNCCGYFNDTQIPNVVEISFMKTNLITQQELNAENTQSYPLNHIDKPNVIDKIDLALNFN